MGSRQMIVRCFHTSVGHLKRARWYNIHKPCTNPEYEDPTYFEREAAKLDLGPTYIDKLGQLWQEKQATQRDLIYRREDSLVKHDSRYWLPEVNLDGPRLGFEKVKALEGAPESVKKIFSVRYGERKDLTDLWKTNILDQVRLHPLDTSSLESRIAKHTALIRHWMMLVEDIARSTPKKPVWLRNMIYYSINHRRKLLRMLRERNVEAFERVLKQLRIAYHVPPLPEDLPKVHSRKGWIEHQISIRVEAEKEKKMNEYHQKLIKERAAFTQRKKERLDAIDKEEEALKAELEALRTQSGETLKVAGTYSGHTIDSVSESQMFKHYYMPDKTDKNKPTSAASVR